ncbi:MAG: C25 family cysteine peptidase [Dehalococcoidia bacterium]
MPLNTLPLNTLLLTAPLNTLPLNTLPLNTLPLNTLPLNTLPLNTLPLNTLPLGTILSTPLNTLPLNTLAPRLLALYGDGSFCNFSASQGYPCPAGITDASSFSDLVAAIRADTGIGTAPLNTLPLNTLPLNTLPLNTLPLNTLGPSGTPLNTLADLFPSGTDLGSIAPSLGALNFGHILLAILDQGHYPWEEVPFDKISPAELGATRSVAYRVEINAGAYAIPGSTALVTVTLPPGFAYKPGTALFTPNGAAAGTPVAPAVSGKVVSWAISGLTPGDVTDALSFELYTSITLGVAGPGVSVNIGGQTGTATESAAVNVIEFEPDGDVATARAVSPGNVYFTYISTSGDTDLFKFPVSNTGNRVAIYVHNLDNKTDADLGVFTPIDPAVNGAAVRPAPLNTLPINDSNPGAAGASQSLPPDPVNDLSVAVAPLNTLPLNTLGATRQLGGTEQAEVISQDTPGTIYYGKVGLYNGGSSPKALSIRISETPAPPAPVCGAPAFPFPGAPATALSLPGAAPLSTLIVVNLKRIEQFYGAAARADVLARLTTLAAHPQTGGGHILAVDTLTAFAAWDAGNTCDPQLANNVVNQISQHIRTVKAAHPELRHVVIVGDDSVIPFARIADETKTGNEDTFASALADQQSPTFGAFATRNILSDDPYGTTEAISYLNRFLYVPQLSVGRLVETPAEINAQVDLFVSSNGVLDPGSGATPQRALVTGYDFFSDAAVKLIEVVAQRFPLSPRVSLNTPPGTAPAAAWGRQDLLDALYGGAGNAPGLITINGHYDPTQAAPANAYDEKGSPVAGATLISTTDIRDAAKALTRSIVWTMGCHAGTSLHDLITGTEVTLDWAQVYAQRGAAVYVANTGFGYGDSAALSLSEVLMTFFADGLDGTQSAGQALRSAKANYFKTQGQYGEFDYKAMQQTVFYGLPMYRIGTGGLVAQLAAEEGVTSQFAAEQVAVTNIPLAPGNDPATGLRVASINVVPNSSVVSTDRGSYYTAGGTPDTLPPVVTGQGAVVIPSVGGAQTTHHRPIEPKVTFEVPGTAPTTTLRAKDALILGLTAQDIQNFDPVIARPSILRGASEPEFAFDQVAFPSQLISTNTYPTNAGVSQHVVVMAGQFFGSGPAGTGTQRVITALNAQLYFGTTGAGQDYVKPQVKTVDASVAGNFATFAVEVEDNAGGADGVRQVYVLFRTASTVAGPVSWTPLNLVRQGTSNRWVGTAPAAGAANVLYYVQAVDASGNVGISFNKGVGHVAGAPQALQQQGLLITTAPAPTPMTPSDSNIFTTPVVVKVAASPANVAVVFTYSVDGGPSLPYSSSGFVVNGPGPHTVVVRGSDGSTGQRGFVIVANPAITILAPKNFALGGNYVAGQVKKANYTCSPSSGASIEICDGTVANGSPIDTSFAGTGPYVEKTFAVTLRDSLNVTLTATVTYRVYANACLVPATISGTTGNDKLKGTPSDDVIRGLGGNDKIEGNGGDDIICTLGGNDEVSAGGGNDVVDAGAGNNNISAGDGDNRVISGAGNDRVNTGSGDDYIDAGAGNNDVRASSGKNKIITGPGNDDIRTGAGDDNIDSGAGNDQIRVGAGNNVVTAGDGNDDVRAGVGNDTLNGGSGTDKCQPGGGTNAITSCEVTLPGNDEDGG